MKLFDGFSERDSMLGLGAGGKNNANASDGQRGAQWSHQSVSFISAQP